MEKYHVPRLEAMSSLLAAKKTGYICSHCFEPMFGLFVGFVPPPPPPLCALKPAHWNLNIVTGNEQDQDLLTLHCTVFCSLLLSGNVVIMGRLYNIKPFWKHTQKLWYNHARSSLSLNTSTSSAPSGQWQAKLWAQGKTMTNCQETSSLVFVRVCIF